jgi:DNA-binding response OmpR family regulator
MLPSQLALVDDDAEFGDYLGGFLRERGVDVSVFHDSAELLTASRPFDFPFYVLDLTLPDVDGLELLRILRRRSTAGVLVVSGRLAPDVFESALQAGADMYLAKPIRFEQVALAIKAVHRREQAARTGAASWRLDRRGQVLLAPDGTRIEVSETDLLVLECFLDAQGGTVARDTLKQRLKHGDQDDADNLLHATIYRLRRRIEKATPMMVPLQSQTRVGYIFKATLTSA